VGEGWEGAKRFDEVSEDRTLIERGATMASVVLAGKEMEVDEDGFIQDPDLWNEVVARELAKKEEGIEEMTEEHWKVVNYLRNYYLEYKIAPMIRKLCKETGFKLQKIYDLFPSGPAKGACKVAGLPKPTGCV
jgi:tRNA 2-thiouridine synthesizing protein E